MCDFRNIKEITLKETSEVIKIDKTTSLDLYNLKGKGYEYPDKPGLYYIVASGAYHMYWNGSEWLREDKDYYVTHFSMKNI